METVKTHYDLLQVAPGASAAEIKQAFRRQIARYHPDKVQHLGDEFQELALSRSAELTIAYKTLIDLEQREAYDRSLAAGATARPEPVVVPPPEPVVEPPVQTDAPTPPAGDAPRRTSPDPLRAGSDALLKRAALAKVDRLFAQAFGGKERPEAQGFDLSCLSKSKLFGRGGRSWLLAKFVPRLTAEAAQDVWAKALRAARAGKATVTVFLLAGEVGSPRDVADALATNRRRAATGVPSVTVLPVDVRDWRAWIPADADPAARALAERLQKEPS